MAKIRTRIMRDSTLAIVVCDRAAIAQTTGQQPSGHQKSSDEFHRPSLVIEADSAPLTRPRARVEMRKRLSKNVLHLAASPRIRTSDA
jgi:hypothetical protein